MVRFRQNTHGRGTVQGHSEMRVAIFSRCSGHFGCHDRPVTVRGRSGSKFIFGRTFGVDFSEATFEGELLGVLWGGVLGSPWSLWRCDEPASGMDELGKQMKRKTRAPQMQQIQQK